MSNYIHDRKIVVLLSAVSAEIADGIVEAIHDYISGLGESVAGVVLTSEDAEVTEQPNE